MEVGGKSDPSFASRPSRSCLSKKENIDSGLEVRENESGAVRKHPSILLTDGRTLSFKKVDKKRVSFGRNTEFAISQISVQEADTVAAMELSKPIPADSTPVASPSLEQFLSAPLSLFRQNDSLSLDSSRAILLSIDSLLSSAHQLDEALFSHLGISASQPSEPQLQALNRSNADLELKIKQLQESIAWVEARIQTDASQAESTEKQISAAKQALEQSIANRVSELETKKDLYSQQVSLYKQLTGISLPSFSGQVLTGVVKGRQDGELKFELHFRREGGCDYRPVTLRMHGLDEMLKHPIMGLAECELVMVFRRMLQAVVYKDS